MNVGLNCIHVHENMSEGPPKQNTWKGIPQRQSNIVHEYATYPPMLHDKNQTKHVETVMVLKNRIPMHFVVAQRC